MIDLSILVLFLSTEQLRSGSYRYIAFFGFNYYYFFALEDLLAYIAKSGIIEKQYNGLITDFTNKVNLECPLFNFDIYPHYYYSFFIASRFAFPISVHPNRISLNKFWLDIIYPFRILSSILCIFVDSTFALMGNNYDIYDIVYWALLDLTKYLWTADMIDVFLYWNLVNVIRWNEFLKDFHEKLKFTRKISFWRIFENLTCTIFFFISINWSVQLIESKWSNIMVFREVGYFLVSGFLVRLDNGNIYNVNGNIYFRTIFCI